MRTLATVLAVLLFCSPALAQKAKPKKAPKNSVKSFEALNTGDVGLPGGINGGPPVIWIVQIKNDNEALIEMLVKNKKTLVFLKGFDTSNFSDGDKVTWTEPLEVTGNYKYNNVAGGTKTVMMVEPQKKQPEKRK